MWKARLLVNSITAFLYANHNTAKQSLSLLLKGQSGCLPFTQNFRKFPDFILGYFETERMRSICLVPECTRFVPRVSAQHGLVYFRFEYGGTAQLLFIDELFKDDLNMMEDEDDTIVFSAISTFMRKDLQRNENFCEAVLPRFSLDEFRGHFRMIRGTMEVLCRGCGHRQGTAGTCIWKTPNSTPQTRCLICLLYTTPESYQPF